MAKEQTYRVSQKYELNMKNGCKEELKVTTTYRIVSLSTFSKAVGLGKKVTPAFADANADTVLDFCKIKFGEEMDELKEILADELRMIDFLNELYEQYSGFERRFGLRVVLCEFKFKDAGK